jgi:hypothetical protein
MNLFKLGDMVLNMDRVNGVQEHPAPADGSPSAAPDTIRVLFDTATIDLTGPEAHALRRWVRHNSRNLAPTKNEDGELLIHPENQLTKVADLLVELVDRARPRDSTTRSVARRLSAMIESYITGQLPPVSARSFEREFEIPRTESPAD